jgi:hypothetical protein
MPSSNVERRTAIIDALPHALRDALAEFDLGRDSCVLSSWLGREVLREHGINATAVPCLAIVANPALWQLAEEDELALAHLVFEGSEEELAAAGGYTVGIGFGSKQPGRWQGHLILTTRNPDRLLDLTLDQASRPRHDMIVEPMSVAVDRKALAGLQRGEGAIPVLDQSGTVVLYLPHPNRDLGWKGGSAWGASGISDVRDDLLAFVIDRIGVDTVR